MFFFGGGWEWEGGHPEGRKQELYRKLREAWAHNLEPSLWPARQTRQDRTPPPTPKFKKVLKGIYTLSTPPASQSAPKFAVGPGGSIDRKIIENLQNRQNPPDLTYYSV